MSEKVKVEFAKAAYLQNEYPGFRGYYSGTEDDLAAAIQKYKFIEVADDNGELIWVNLDHIKSVKSNGYVETD